VPPGGKRSIQRSRLYRRRRLPRIPRSSFSIAGSIHEHYIIWRTCCVTVLHPANAPLYSSRLVIESTPVVAPIPLTRLPGGSRWHARGGVRHRFADEPGRIVHDLNDISILCLHSVSTFDPFSDGDASKTGELKLSWLQFCFVSALSTARQYDSRKFT